MEEKILIKGIFMERRTPIIILLSLTILLLILSGGSFIDFFEGDGFYVDQIPFFLSILCLISVIFVYNMTKKGELSVTNKRVYGIALFEKRVDLPLDSISAVGTSWLWGVDVGTSSGRIHFKLVKNKNEIHSVLSKLLMERQQEKASANIQTTSNADELKKFKDLLDSGVITQAEFDEKKKQLLGL